MPKTVVVVGVTGNQGGSVARRFLKDPAYHVRGCTRQDPNSESVKPLVDAGIEIVQVDLDDYESVRQAFKGASVIFTVTNYWEPFFRPDCRRQAAERGISCRKFAYDVEYRHGKNMADAANETVETLDENGFLVSTLSHAYQSSNMRFHELYHFDAKADIFPNYVKIAHPALAVKMSCIQTGYFMTSYKLAPEAYFSKMPDDSYVMRFATAPDALVPHLDVNADTGNFVYAVSKLPPGRAYIAEGSTCSWTEYMALWSKATGKQGRYEQVTVDQMIAGAPDSEFGKEIAYMFDYSTDPGYCGGDKLLLTAADIRQKGIECPMTPLEAFFASADWSMVFNR